MTTWSLPYQACSIASQSAKRPEIGVVFAWVCQEVGVARWFVMPLSSYVANRSNNCSSYLWTCSFSGFRTVCELQPYITHHGTWRRLSTHLDIAAAWALHFKTPEGRKERKQTRSYLLFNIYQVYPGTTKSFCEGVSHIWGWVWCYRGQGSKTVCPTSV